MDWNVRLRGALLAPALTALVAMGMIPDLQSQLTTTLLLIVFLLAVYFVFRRGRYVAAEASQA